MEPTEFQEIAHTGGRLTFIYKEGGGLSVRLEHSRPSPATVFQVCIALDGQIVDYVAIGGIGSPSFYPQPSILAYLISDREGKFGQECKVCDSYFRTSVPSRWTVCPYCGDRQRGITFLTQNQLQFLTKYFNAYVEASQKGKTVTVDLDEMVDALTHNSQSWVYTEQRQQSGHACKCGCSYDILGNYGLCPACGSPNYVASFGRTVAGIEAQFDGERIDPRNVPGEMFARVFSEFEALGNCVRRQLSRLPANETRRSEVRRINFQRLTEAADLLERCFAIALFKDIAPAEVEYLSLMLSRRHLIIHNGGRVDERYLQMTKDSTVRLNEVVRVNLDDAKKTLSLMRKCGINIVNGWQSIK